MKCNLMIWNIIGWTVGVVFLAIGVINMFWGNDFWFGVFIAFLSLIYFPPVNRIIKNRIGFSIHFAIKIILGLFILWAALGVGELFDKIDLMLSDLF